MNTKEIHELKKTLSLTPRQQSIIIGLLLGDGHMESVNDRVFRLKVEHSIKQKDYVDWLWRELKNWTHSPPKKRIRTSLGKKLIAYGFTTYTSGKLRFYRQQFYKDGKKVIPRLIHKFLDPLALAIWFMDDGSKKSSKHKSYVIHSLGYTKKELQILTGVLDDKFKIKAGLHKQRNNSFRIYIYSESAHEFRKLIEPYVHKTMQYKF